MEGNQSFLRKRTHDNVENVQTQQKQNTTAETEITALVSVVTSQNHKKKQKGKRKVLKFTHVYAEPVASMFSVNIMSPL